MESQGAKVQMGPIEPTADGASARVRSLTIEGPAGEHGRWTLTFKSLLLNSADETATSWRIGRAQGEDVRLGVGDAFLKVGDIDLKNISLPKSAPTTLDPRQPTASLVRFLRTVLTARTGAVVLKSLNWAGPGTSPEASNTLGLLSIDNFENGVIAALHLHDLSASSSKDQSATKIADISLEKMSLSVLIDLIDPQTYRSPAVDRPWRPIVARASLTGFDLRGPGAHTVLPQIEFGSLEARRLGFDPTGTFDLIVTNSPQLREQPALLAQLTNGLTESFRVTKASVRAFASDDGAEPPVRRTKIDAMDFVEMTPRTIKSANLRGLQTLTGDAGIGVGQIAIDDLKLAASASNPTSPSRMELPQFSNLALTDMRLVRPGVNASLGRVKVTAGDYVGATPSHLEASLEGVSFPVADLPDSPLKANLAELKLDQLQLSASFSAAWKEASEQFDLSSARISASSVGELSMSASLTGVSRSLLEQPQGFAQALSSAQLAQARLNFREMGLTTRVLDKFAEVNKLPVAKVRSALTANMPMMLGAVTDAASRNRLIFAAIGFLNDPKSLSVFTTITSPQPLAKVWEAIQKNPASLPGLLKLDAVANRPS